MNEVTQFQPSKPANSAWGVLKRILAAIIILIGVICFVANAAGLVGIWIVRQPARNTVTTLSAFVNGKLERVDQALARVGARSDEGRQALARVNSAASNLGDQLQQGSPQLAALTRAASDDLAPRIAEMRAQVAALHDGVITVNAALETLDSLPFITIPTFSDELSAVSGRVDAARESAQELRAAIDQARTMASANVVAAVTERTNRIETVMTQIKSATVKYQTAAVQKRQQVTASSQRLLRAISLLVLLLTALFVVMATGQVLMVYVCWQYVRRGRFPFRGVGNEGDV